MEIIKNKEVAYFTVEETNAFKTVTRLVNSIRNDTEGYCQCHSGYCMDNDDVYSISDEEMETIYKFLRECSNGKIELDAYE